MRVGESCGLEGRVEMLDDCFPNRRVCVRDEICQTFDGCLQRRIKILITDEAQFKSSEPACG